MGTHGQTQQGDMMSQMHSQMMQGQGGMHGNINGGMGARHGGMGGRPTMPGQDAFGAIQEVVQILQSDSKTLVEG